MNFPKIILFASIITNESFYRTRLVIIVMDSTGPHLLYLAERRDWVCPLVLARKRKWQIWQNQSGWYCQITMRFRNRRCTWLTVKSCVLFILWNAKRINQTFLWKCNPLHWISPINFSSSWIKVRVINRVTFSKSKTSKSSLERLLYVVNIKNVWKPSHEMKLLTV